MATSITNCGEFLSGAIPAPLVERREGSVSRPPKL
jgi:hypothetical protein